MANAAAAGGALVTLTADDADVQRLARLVARRIWYWTQSEEGAGDPDCQLTARGRRIRPGDAEVIKFHRQSQDAAKIVEALAYRELTRYAANADIKEFLGDGGAAAAT